MILRNIPRRHRQCFLDDMLQIKINALLETFLAKREILRAARFFGIILPADFIILLSALRAAVVAAALSPDATAANAFLVAVLTALRRAVLIAFFLADTKILFSDDL